MTADDWRERAECRGLDPELFFPERGASLDEAWAICRRCEVQSECLVDALRGYDKFGVWGGLSERERRRLRHRLRADGLITPPPPREPVFRDEMAGAA